MHKCPLLGWHCHLLPDLLCDLTHEAHLVQGQLVLSRRALHNRCQEALGIEEARQPHRVRGVEVSDPGLELLDP